MTLIKRQDAKVVTLSFGRGVEELGGFVRKVSWGQSLLQYEINIIKIYPWKYRVDTVHTV